MKKASIFVAALLLATAGVQAQEQETTTYGPQAGSFGVELNFNPFGIFLGGYDAEGIHINPTFSIDGLKVRYFFNEDMAIRGTIDFSTESNKDATYDTDNNLYSTTKNATTTFGLTPGFEYHVTHFKRGSVYVGGEIGFNVGSTKSSLTYEDPNDIQVNSESKGSIFGFGVGVFTGIDFYLTENLYLGAELGLGYQTTKTTPNKSSTNGSTTVESSNYTSTSSFGFNCEPSIRLGWTF